jgi:hypothetical protein
MHDADIGLKLLKKLWSFTSEAQRHREMQCLMAMEKLRVAHETNRRGSDSRIAMDRSRRNILVAHDGVVLKIKPEEFDYSMRNETECDFELGSGGVFLTGGWVPRLRIDRLMKLIILERVLADGAN